MQYITISQPPKMFFSETLWIVLSSRNVFKDGVGITFSSFENIPVPKAGVFTLLVSLGHMGRRTVFWTTHKIH